MSVLPLAGCLGSPTTEMGPVAVERFSLVQSFLGLAGEAGVVGGAGLSVGVARVAGAGDVAWGEVGVALGDCGAGGAADWAFEARDAAEKDRKRMPARAREFSIRPSLS